MDFGPGFWGAVIGIGVELWALEEVSWIVEEEVDSGFDVDAPLPDLLEDSWSKQTCQGTLEDGW